MFALSKGLGQYLRSDLKDPANFYAKIVDLLLSEQADDGSWPADLRDDGSIIGSTAFAIMSLGRVGQPPIVNGTVFDDADANGTRSTSLGSRVARNVAEAGLAGATVYVDVNGDGVLDNNEPSTTSGADGTYSLQNLPEGTYTVREIPQAGFECTSPPGCAYANIEMTLGATINGKDFGNRRPPAPPAPAAAAPAPTQAASAAKTCGSVRHVNVHIRQFKGEKILSAKLTLNGKNVKVTRKNGRFTATIDLRQLVKGRYTVKMTLRIRKGGKVRTIHATRKYRTCTPHRESGPPAR
jgi:hypothetical protein